MPPGEPPKKVVLPPAKPEGVYWPTVVMGVAAAGALLAVASRQWAQRAPAEEEPAAAAAAQAEAAALPAPDIRLAAPAPAALKAGRPVVSQSPDPAQDPRSRVAGLPYQNPRSVQPEIETNTPPVRMDPSSLQVKGGDVVGANAPSSGDPFTDPDALRAQLGMPANLSFHGEGGPDKFSTQVITSAKAWKALWKRISHGEAPPIDFDKQMLVAVFAGKRKAGSAFEIAWVKEQKDGKLHVAYRKTGAGGAKGKTWKPYHIVSIPSTERPVVFEEAR